MVLADAIWPRSTGNTALRNVLLVVAGSLLIAVSAHIQVPMWPVPMTMQTFAVLLIALALGSRLAGATVALYLSEGAIGLPVFAKGGGLAYFMGPTAGYLIGFFFAALAVGWLSERGWGRPALRILGAMLVGSAIIYLFGVAWLAGFVGFEKALAHGLFPFLLGDGLKALLAAALLPMAWRLVGAVPGSQDLQD